METLVEPVAIPEEHPYPASDSFWEGIRDIDNHMEAYKSRTEWIKKGMYAFVSKRWVRPLAQWIGSRRCLEVMAGKGWLAEALRQEGVDIRATDNFSWYYDRDGNNVWGEPVTTVQKLGAVAAVRRYGKDIDVLIMSWPYMNPVAGYVIRELHKVNPKALVVYIGEGNGGCCAAPNFFEHFEEVQDPLFTPVEQVYQRWWGLHDRPQLGRYKP